MRKVLAAALLVCALAAVGLYLRTKREAAGRAPPAPLTQSQAPSSRTSQSPGQSSPASNPNRTSGVPASAAAPPESQSVQSATPRPEVAGTLLFGGPESTPVNLPGETVIENVRGTVRNYGSMFDGNPVGTNPEITAALNGDNPKGVHFLDPEKGMRINSKGELVDPWGTPFFFHQLSGTETEIRSAGPDKQMWTADDLVIK